MARSITASWLNWLARFNTFKYKAGVEKLNITNYFDTTISLKRLSNSAWRVYKDHDENTRHGFYTSHLAQNAGTAINYIGQANELIDGLTK